MLRTRANRLTTRILLIAIALTFTGCAATQAPIFYPGPPDPPRYQYLKSISTEADLKSSGLSKALSEGTFAFQKAFDVTAYKNTLLVTDNRIRGYAVINFDTEKIHFISQDPSNSRSLFSTPFGITVDDNGRRYIADRAGKRVLVYDRNDLFLKDYTFNHPGSSPVAVAIGNDKLYVAHFKNRIDVVDLKNDSISEFKTKEISIEWPVSLDFADGHLFVVGMLNYRISKFNTTGELVASYGDLGDGTGKLARPKSVAVDRQNRVLALDASFANFQIFREDAQLLGFVASGGTNPENLSLPAGLCISYDLAPFFQKYAAPGFKLEYIVAVANQAGPSKINIYGFGKMKGSDNND